MEILGVSFDSVEANAAFAREQAFPFRLLCDTDKSMSQAYGAAKGRRSLFPSRITYIIAADGTIAWAEKVDDIKTHVPAAIERLTQG